VSFVLDCTVTMAWAFEDLSDAWSDALLERLGTSGAVVPTVWCVEVADALLEAEGLDRLRPADSARFLRLLHSLPIVVDRETPARAHAEGLACARKHDLSSASAAYLELAMREGLPLATRDAELRRAAGAAGVALA
jgi:predicted nucleic acid-binding protein